MSQPGEYKTVQARIIAYAEEIGWTFVPRSEAEARRGFDTDAATPADRARPASLYFGDVLHHKLTEFNPKYKDAEGALVGEFQRLNNDITGNRDFLGYLRNEGKFFAQAEDRELDLKRHRLCRRHASARQAPQRLRSDRRVLRPQRRTTGRGRMWSSSSTAFRCW